MQIHSAVLSQVANVVIGTDVSIKTCRIAGRDDTR